MAAIAGLVIATTVLHRSLPVAPYGWHLAHLVAEKLYYVPILMAAAWFSTRGALAASASITILFGYHVLADWSGQRTAQADQVAEMWNYNLAAVVAGVLFERMRRALQEVESAHEETIEALTASLDLRERATGGHSRRVRDFALRIADEMGLSDPAFRQGLALGALLHDVGKIGIRDDVLLKEGPLGDAEWVLMRSHPAMGSSLLGRIRFLAEARALVQAHHERFDGQGYPRGLAGSDIPLPARIFAVADAFDALVSDRPYRRAVGIVEAQNVVRRCRGSQFDPEVVDAFLRVPLEDWSALAARTGLELRGTVRAQSSSSLEQAART
ncbi:MAG: HD-GYP domain-containing protein [Acidobacteriota bacterium]